MNDTEVHTEDKTLYEIWAASMDSPEGRILELHGEGWANSGKRHLFTSAMVHEIPMRSNTAIGTSQLENKWPFDHDFFDAVLIPEGFEKLLDVASIIKESYRVLKPGGRLLGVSLSNIPTLDIDQYERRPENKEQVLIDCALRMGFRRTRWEGVSVWSGKKKNSPVYFGATKYVHNRKRVSIVILCHNQARYLRRAIHSALAQTYDPYEIIVVNNGSSDDSAQILEEFGKQIRVITREKGIPGSVNAGFEASQGEYLTWTGADNVMFPHMLAVLAGHLDTYQNIGGVYSDNALIDSQGSFLYNMHRPDYDPGLLLDVSRHWLIGISFMFRREIFKSVGGCDISLEFGEDYDLWLKIASHYPIRHIPDRTVLMAYEDHSTGLSDEKRHNRLQCLDYTRRKILKIQEKYRKNILMNSPKDYQPATKANSLG